MPKFSQESLAHLAECDPRLRLVFNEVVKYFDCKVLEGHRGEEAQHKAFLEGNSKLDWPNGKHNKLPSLAVDVAPFPVDWNDAKRFHFFAGFVLGTASVMGISLRWGGDWNSDTQVKDNKFNDLVHFEVADHG